jgi:PAS domain S-box-containing protein
VRVSIAETVLPVVAAALESSGTIVAMFDVPPDAPTRLGFNEANGEFLRFSGYCRAEVIGRDLDLIAEPGAAAMTAIEAALAGFKPYRGDLACRGRDRALKWLGLHLMPVPDPASGVRQYVLIGRDITAQRREGAQARVVQALLLKSFMIADRAVAIVAADDRIMMANPHLETLLGVSPGGLTGKFALDTILPSYRQMVLDARTAQVAGDAETSDLNVEMDCQGRAPVPASARFARMGAGELAGIVRMTILPRRSQAAAATQATQATQPRVAGKIRFVSLDAVRAVLRDKWEGAATRVLDTAEKMIRRRLSPADILTRTEDKGFAICFAAGTESEASDLASSIAREITRHLIGRGEDEAMVRISAVISQVATAADGPPDMLKLGLDMNQAEAALQGAEWQAPVPEPVISAAGGAPAASFIRIPAPRSNGLSRQAFPESNLAQELAALQAAASLPAQHMVLVDVGFATFLSRASTDAYLEACVNLPQQLRERLYPVLSPLARGTTQSLLQNLMRRMSGCCAGFAMRIEDLRAPEFDLASCRPAVAVIDVRQWDYGNSVPTERLRKIANLLHAYRVRVLALNVATPETGQALLKMGVDWQTLVRKRPGH